MTSIKKKLKRIVDWTKIKLRIENKGNIKIYFHEREIWWTSLGSNIGYEQDGKNRLFERPVLIFKKFNKFILWVLPLTSQVKTGKYYYQFEYDKKKYSIILSQLRIISSKRLLRKIRNFPKDDFDNVKVEIRKLV